MLNIYGNIFVFFTASLLFVLLNMALVRILAPRRPNREKNKTYECGEEPIGFGWVRFHVRYYLYALVYIVFAVETVFLFPWAIVFQELGLFAFVEMMIFIGIRIVGYLHACRPDAFDWD